MASLIDNAIKYSPEGGEVIIYTQTENGFVEFSVKDTGIGIPPKYISPIFERFFRVDSCKGSGRRRPMAFHCETYGRTSASEIWCGERDKPGKPVLG